MEAKSTPGPWKISDTRTISGPNHAIIGKVYSRAPIQRPMETAEGDANARLIAKAYLIPEVREVLTDLLEDFSTGFIAQESHNADLARGRREKQLSKLIAKLNEE